MNKLQVYTDGACSGNPGPGGWACVFVENNKLLARLYGYNIKTTNNHMELLAVIKSIEFVIKNYKSVDTIEIFTDSNYVYNSITLNWYLRWIRNNENRPNMNLWKKVEELSNKINLVLKKVKGHSDNEYNNLCDDLAVQARINLITNEE